MALTKTLTAVLDWLRAGYPDGVPPTDYFPLLALLNRQLSPTEVHEIAQTLMDEGDDITKVDIGVAVNKVTNELPSDDDIRRVAARLAAAGIPTASDTLDGHDGSNGTTNGTGTPDDTD